MTKIFLFLLSFWLGRNSLATSVEKFYPFGSIHGDNQLPTSYEAHSTQINLLVPVKYYGQNYSSLFVNSNGLLSFISPLSTFVNVQLPLDYPVIGAFYANVDIRASGRVLYRESHSADLLGKASDEIHHYFPSHHEFQATSLFIATWDHVGYYNRKSDKMNTFQTVIISNGSESFVQLAYADDGIQWLQGEGDPGTGMPDAKAQVAFVAADGRFYAMKASGADQMRNLPRLSNVGRPGLWMFRVGNILSSENVAKPEINTDIQMDESPNVESQSCTTGFSLCHSQADCIDAGNATVGFCCVCKRSFYGNGFFCLKDGIPVRANGRVNLEVNNVKLAQISLQAYVVVADGRIYVALSKIPPTLGSQLQLLYPITTMLGWLFAIPIGHAINGFQLTGGVLNHTSEILYKDTRDRVRITQYYLGLDMFDQLKLEVTIRGSVPYGGQYSSQQKITIDDYQQQFNHITSGFLRSVTSSMAYFLNSESDLNGAEHTLSLEQSIMYKPSCHLSSLANSGLDFHIGTYYRVKTARNFVVYEPKENILRFAASSKVSLVSENEDPCLEGKVKCVVNSSCIVEGDAFRCVCNPGFQNMLLKESNPMQEFGCYDVNECVEGKANCDSNAICINEVGSYSCLCKPSYSGNGQYCYGMESPCEKDSSICNQPYSHCTDYKDHRTCNCELGFEKVYSDYEKIRFTCVDINECETLANHASICPYNGSICMNTVGSYICHCTNGYAINGIRCNLAKNVSCEIARDCSLNGECVYNETAGKYACQCIKGYYGDGYNCVLSSSPSRKRVAKQCLMGYCWCPSEYTLVDDVCILNDTTEGSSPASTLYDCNVAASNICHPNAKCVYHSSLQGYRCQCNDGFYGNGKECKEESAEMSCKKLNNCDYHATCLVDDMGHANCVCNQNYHGDGIHCIYAGVCNSNGDCGENEECFYSDVSQSYDCKCVQNFVKDKNGPCRQLKRCGFCHENGECVLNSTTGDGECRCKLGFIGDGIDECDKMPITCNIFDNCSPNANCIYNVTVANYICQCKQGYDGNGTICFSIQTCFEAPQMCDSNAKCVKYGATNLQSRCECKKGFAGNGSHCFEIPRQEGGFLLVNRGMATLRLPYTSAMTTNEGYPVQLQASQIAIGLATDCAEGTFYWNDYIGKNIKRATYKGKDIRDVVNSNISESEGLAIDWVNREIYWTDSGKRTIEKANLDGTNRKVIISKRLFNPRGIAVNPYKRKIFWSDWNRARPRIEYSNFDGSDRAVLVEGSSIQLPNGIAYDFWGTDELCWTDSGLKTLQCIDVENKIQRIISSNCTYPFGLAISIDKYFWTDWTLGKIESVDRRGIKHNPINLPPIGSGTLYGIAAVIDDACP